MNRILILIFCLASVNLLGQPEIPMFDFKIVDGVDSIVFESISGNSSWRGVYYYSNGERVRINSFDNNELYSYRLFKNNDNQGTQYECYFGQSSVFDPKKNDWVNFLNTKDCSLKVNKYSEKKLVEMKEGGIRGTDTTFNEITSYYYDSKQRLSRVVTCDVFIGLRGSFKPYSVELKEFGEKSKTVVRSKDYSYYLNRVEILYKVNDSLTGKQIIELNTKGNPSSIISFDNKDNITGDLFVKYDEKDRLICESWKTYHPITIWGQEGEVANDGTMLFEYDKAGRLISESVIYSDDYQTKKVYNYY